MKKLLTTALLGMTSVALIATSANAQIEPVPINSNVGDLILGFRVTDNAGAGATQNLEIDLGNMANFTSLAPNTTVNLDATVANSFSGLSDADLASIYDILNPDMTVKTPWYQRSDLVFGAIATSGNAISSVPGFSRSVIWATSAENPAGTPSTPLDTNTFGSQNNAGTQYTTMVVTGAPGAIYGMTSTANSATSANILSTDPGSWTYQELTAHPGEAFNHFNLNVLDVPVTAVGSGNAAILDLYQLIPFTTGHATPGQIIGKFSLTSGDLTYTSVPEPSSLGLIGVGFLSLVGMVLIRRRRSVLA